LSQISYSLFERFEGPEWLLTAGRGPDIWWTFLPFWSFEPVTKRKTQVYINVWTLYRKLSNSKIQRLHHFRRNFMKKKL